MLGIAEQAAGDQVGRARSSRRRRGSRDGPARARPVASSRDGSTESQNMAGRSSRAPGRPVDLEVQQAGLAELVHPAPHRRFVPVDGRGEGGMAGPPVPGQLGQQRLVPGPDRGTGGRVCPLQGRRSSGAEDSGTRGSVRATAPPAELGQGARCARQGPGLKSCRIECAEICTTRRLPGSPRRNRASRCSGSCASTTQMISVPPEARRTHLVSGRRARASAMESAPPGVVCSRRNQSTRPSWAPSTTPRTRSPAYLAAACGNAGRRSGRRCRSPRRWRGRRPAGSSVRIWTIWRSTSSSWHDFHAN